MHTLFKRYGVGVGVRKPYQEALLNSSSRKPVQWGEVISENWMKWENGTAGPTEDVFQIRRQMPIALHGVSMSLGSADPINLGYLQRLQELKNRLEPMWISDHLCWTGVGGHNLHDLFPLPMDEDVVNHVVGKITQVQEFLGERILIENVSSYLQFKSSTMTEWEFLSEIVEKADCGILLDINNIFVNSKNHGFDPKTYLDHIPHHRVAQIHLAGHVQEGNLLIDTHDQNICSAVYDLFGYFNSLNPDVSTMIEWDQNFPPWETLQIELFNVQKIQSRKINESLRSADAV